MDLIFFIEFEEDLEFLKKLIKAISPNVKVKYIGLKPWKKKHEEMISVNDALNTVEFIKHYVILPNSQTYKLTLKKYAKIKKNSKKIKEINTYKGNTNSEFLSTEEINKTIKNNIIGIEY